MDRQREAFLTHGSINKDGNVCTTRLFLFLIFPSSRFIFSFLKKSIFLSFRYFSFDLFFAPFFLFLFLLISIRWTLELFACLITSIDITLQIVRSFQSLLHRLSYLLEYISREKKKLYKENIRRDGSIVDDVKEGEATRSDAHRQSKSRADYVFIFHLNAFASYRPTAHWVSSQTAVSTLLQRQGMSGKKRCQHLTISISGLYRIPQGKNGQIKIIRTTTKR